MIETERGICDWKSRVYGQMQSGLGRELVEGLGRKERMSHREGYHQAPRQ